MEARSNHSDWGDCPSGITIGQGSQILLAPARLVYELRQGNVHIDFLAECMRPSATNVTVRLDLPVVQQQSNICLLFPGSAAKLLHSIELRIGYIVSICLQYAVRPASWPQRTVDRPGLDTKQDFAPVETMNPARDGRLPVELNEVCRESIHTTLLD